MDGTGVSERALSQAAWRLEIDTGLEEQREAIRLLLSAVEVLAVAAMRPSRDLTGVLQDVDDARALLEPRAREGAG